MMKKVLIIAVHPDDETLGCGGTILKHLEQNDEVYCLFITSGNEEQKKTISLISDFYKFNNTFSLYLPELELADVSLNTIIPKIGEVITEVTPDVLYVPYRSDIHSDHRAVFNACLPFTKTFRYPFIKEVLMCEVISETEFAPAIPSEAFIPNVYVDITSYIDKKLLAMSIYEKEIMLEPYPRSPSSIKALARIRGSRAGVMYAEAFMLLYERR